jgi:hypothetical protein
VEAGTMTFSSEYCYITCAEADEKEEGVDERLCYDTCIDIDEYYNGTRGEADMTGYVHTDTLARDEEARWEVERSYEDMRHDLNTYLAEDRHELDVYDAVIDDLYDNYLRELENEQRQRFVCELNHMLDEAIPAVDWNAPITEEEIEAEYTIWVNNIRWQQDMKGVEPNDCPTCGQRSVHENMQECMSCFVMGVDPSDIHLWEYPF